MDPSAYPLHAEVEETHWWFVGRRRILDRVLRSVVQPTPAPAPRILEVGSGTGGNLGILAALGPVTCVEPDEQARRVSRERHPSVAHFATVDEIPSNERYDLILLLDVLEHLDEPTAELVRLRQLLQPDGNLVVTVPAHPWLFGRHDVYLHHRRRYTESALRRELDESGFSLRHISPFNTLAFPFAVAYRALEAVVDVVSPYGGEAEPRGMKQPPALLNAVLATAFGLERFVVPRARLPLGLSLVAVCRARAPEESSAQPRRTENAIAGTLSSTSR